MMSKLSFSTIALGIVLSFTLWSCGEKSNVKSENIYSNDFETMYGFNDRVDRGKANSGACYYTIDSTIQYSFGFIRKFNKISAKPYKKLKFSAFVLIPDPNTSLEMTIQVLDPNFTPVKIQSAPVTGQIGINKWTEVKLELPLDRLYAPSNEVRCFFFNPNKNQVFVDDFKVEFFE